MRDKNKKTEEPDDSSRRVIQVNADELTDQVMGSEIEIKKIRPILSDGIFTSREDMYM
jgi:hypothetical protein